MNILKSMRAMSVMAAVCLALLGCEKKDEAGAAGGGEGHVAEGGGTVGNGAHREESDFDGPFTVETSVRDDGTLIARVRAGNGFHINEQFPWALNINEGAPVAGGSSFNKDQAASFGEYEVIFEVGDGSSAQGAVEGMLRMSVCNDDACLTPRETVSWNLTN